jgi:hypothetical protein
MAVFLAALDTVSLPHLLHLHVVVEVNAFAAAVQEA